MTHEKARDFFSAYHEGALEPALRLSLEQKFASDQSLREEYARFELTLTQLAGLQNQPIEVPFDINELISVRLDRQLWEQKRSTPANAFARLRMVAWGGLAVVALAGTVITLRHSNSGSVPAGIIGTGGSEQLSVVIKHDVVSVGFAPSNKSTIVFRNEPGDKPFAQVVADKSSPLDRAIENPNPGTELISIQVLDAPSVEHVLLALPGTRSTKVAPGSGTLEDFAKALADKYRVAVKMTGVDPLTQVSWDMNTTDALKAAEASLKDHYTVDQRDGNLLTISPN